MHEAKRGRAARMLVAAVGIVGAALMSAFACSSGIAPGTYCSTAPGPSVCLQKAAFEPGETIRVDFAGGPAMPKDWIAIYPADCCSPTCPSGSNLWKYCATDTRDSGGTPVSSGSVTIDSSANACNWPLSPGDWQVLYLVDDGYSPIAELTFHVNGATGAAGQCGGAGCPGGTTGGGCTSDSQCGGECPRCSSGHCDVGYVSSITGNCVF